MFDAINWHSFFFLFFALVACVFAVAVVWVGNIVRMAFFLVISLGAVAGLFFLAGADFVGAMQLMIYVGGTLVLLIFGVMLTAQDSIVSLKIGLVQWITASIAGIALLAVLLIAVWNVGVWIETETPQAAEPVATRPTAAPLGTALVGVRVDRLEQKNETLLDGMSGYLLPFEIVSVHLLVVLIAAAFLARAKRRKQRATDETIVPRG